MDDTVGIAFTGGGIRSASYAAGALFSLGVSGFMENVDMMSSVSGGGYALSSYLTFVLENPLHSNQPTSPPPPGEHNQFSPAFHSFVSRLPPASRAGVLLYYRFFSRCDYLVRWNNVIIIWDILRLLAAITISLLTHTVILAAISVFIAAAVNGMMGDALRQALGQETVWLAHVAVAIAIFLGTLIIFPALISLIVTTLAPSFPPLARHVTPRNSRALWATINVCRVVYIMLAVVYIALIAQNKVFVSAPVSFQLAIWIAFLLFVALLCFRSFALSAPIANVAIIAVPLLTPIIVFWIVIGVASSRVYGAHLPFPLVRSYSLADPDTWSTAVYIATATLAFFSLFYDSLSAFIHRYYQNSLANAFYAHASQSSSTGYRTTSKTLSLSDLNAPEKSVPLFFINTTANDIHDQGGEKALVNTDTRSSSTRNLSRQQMEAKEAGGKPSLVSGAAATTQPFVFSAAYAGSDALGYSHFPKTSSHQQQDAPISSSTPWFPLRKAMALSGAALSVSLGLMDTDFRPFRLAIHFFNMSMGTWVSFPLLPESWLRKWARRSTFASMYALFLLALIQDWLVLIPFGVAIAILVLSFQWDEPWLASRWAMSSTLIRSLVHACGYSWTTGPDGTPPYLSLSDGGHVDNSGLFELFRRKTRIVLCFDGSHDPEITSNSITDLVIENRYRLHQVGIDVQLTGLADDGQPNNVDLIATLLKYQTQRTKRVVAFRISYRDWDVRTNSVNIVPNLVHGILLFANHRVVTNDMGVLDAPDGLFSGHFPFHSTGNQFITPEIFLKYAFLGKRAAAEMVAYLSRWGSPDDSSSSFSSSSFSTSAAPAPENVPSHQKLIQVMSSTMSSWMASPQASNPSSSEHSSEHSSASSAGSDAAHLYHSVDSIANESDAPPPAPTSPDMFQFSQHVLDPSHSSIWSVLHQGPISLNMDPFERKGSFTPRSTIVAVILFFLLSIFTSALLSGLKLDGTLDISWSSAAFGLWIYGALIPFVATVAFFLFIGGDESVFHMLRVDLGLRNRGHQSVCSHLMMQLCIILFTLVVIAFVSCFFAIIISIGTGGIPALLLFAHLQSGCCNPSSSVAYPLLTGFLGFILILYSLFGTCVIGIACTGSTLCGRSKVHSYALVSPQRQFDVENNVSMLSVGLLFAVLQVVHSVPFALIMALRHQMFAPVVWQWIALVCTVSAGLFYLFGLGLFVTSSGLASWKGPASVFSLPVVASNSAFVYLFYLAMFDPDFHAYTLLAASFCTYILFVFLLSSFIYVNADKNINMDAVDFIDSYPYPHFCVQDIIDVARNQRQDLGNTHWAVSKTLLHNICSLRYGQGVVFSHPTAELEATALLNSDEWCTFLQDACRAVDRSSNDAIRFFFTFTIAVLLRFGPPSGRSLQSATISVFSHQCLNLIATLSTLAKQSISLTWDQVLDIFIVSLQKAGPNLPLEPKSMREIKSFDPANIYPHHTHPIPTPPTTQ